MSRLEYYEKAVAHHAHQKTQLFIYFLQMTQSYLYSWRVENLYLYLGLTRSKALHSCITFHLSETCVSVKNKFLKVFLIEESVVSFWPLWIFKRTFPVSIWYSILWHITPLFKFEDVGKHIASMTNVLIFVKHNVLQCHNIYNSILYLVFWESYLIINWI